METDFTSTTKRGDHGPGVKRVQEWLSIHNCATAIDSDFGPATELALKTFQQKLRLPVTGVADQVTFAALVQPMTDALKPIAAGSSSLGEMVVAYGRQHVASKPIEAGGDNRGPWVRLYMAGNDGAAWPWCAGFATFILRQACQTLHVPMPHPYAFGCDYLAGKAEANGTFLRMNSPADFGKVKPGYLFLIRKTMNSWQHIGIVESLQGEACFTFEGNTNDDGSSNGFEAVRRTRGLANKDFLIV